MSGSQGDAPWAHKHKVWNRVDDKTFLRNLGGYTEDRQTGREGLTLSSGIHLCIYELIFCN